MDGFSIDLAYTPRGAIDGEPFTESLFCRRSIHRAFEFDEVALVLVDVWNFGWDDGPRMPDGKDLAYERGITHASRKRKITEEVIVPVLSAARGAGVQVFHGNLDFVLKRYPQWIDSTTREERRSVESDAKPSKVAEKPSEQVPDPKAWPPKDWVEAWREEHLRLVWRRHTEWDKGVLESSKQIDLPGPVRPADGDLLVYSQTQFHRLLTERRIRALFYAGFEADQCVQFKGYGIANMQDLGYLCSVIRDATTTYEIAETVLGEWRTRCAIDDIEQRWGYSVMSSDFIQACQGVTGKRIP